MIKLKKRYIFAVAAFFAVIAAAVVIFFKVMAKKEQNSFTYAEAAKLIAYAATDYSQENSGTALSENGKYWYTGYVDAVNESGLFPIKNPLSSVKYSDVYELTKRLGTDGFSELENKKGYISRQEFIDIYMQLLDFFEYGDDIGRVEAAVAGTPTVLNEAGEWEVYTTKGQYIFTGLVLDDKIDKTVTMITAGNEILAIENTLYDTAEYKNIWIKSGSEKNVDTNVYGADRTFSIKGLSEPLENVLADIQVNNGEITAINIKTDTITGNVLTVTEDYVEVEGYGKVPLDEYFMIYDIYNQFAVKTYKDIVVGYSLQDFIVAEGKICGAVISKPLDAKNIRVIIKDTGFKNLFHDSVQITCSAGFTVSYADTLLHYNSGDIYEVLNQPENISLGRITVKPDDGGEIKILSITRSQGNPSYEGTIELDVRQEGILVINDVDIEKYLKRVVPSEMPASYSVEALKVQAVCARSYAYKQLSNNRYSAYGAHVDDSTQFQVYNNTTEYASSNEAILSTAGQVLTYDGEVVQTYYYSTSCGYTTDVSIWGSDNENYPYFKSRAVSSTEKDLDLTDEDTFAAFITSTDENDYDYSYALYRWELDADIDSLSSSFNSKLNEKYQSNPTKILTKNEAGEFKSADIKSIGTITDITVNNRVAGGAINSLTVTGTQATVRIDSESLIRGLLGIADKEMITHTGTTKMSSLPSTFCIFRPTYSNGTLTGYQIIGGGYGHGIGMSQNAVNTMAAKGMSYAQILQFFYPDTSVG
jgi:stage II sporulation protein D